MSDKPEPEIIPPRPRGRPRKNPAPDPIILEQGDAGAQSGTTAKPGSRRSKSDKVATWAGDIYAIHELAAAMLQMPFLRISEEQAQKIALPAYETASKYGFEGGAGPELRLMFALGTVYVPLAIQVQMEILRRKAEAARTAGSSGPASPATPAAAAEPEPTPAAGPEFQAYAAAPNGAGHGASRDA